MYIVYCPTCEYEVMFDKCDELVICPCCGFEFASNYLNPEREKYNWLYLDNENFNDFPKLIKYKGDGFL